jgi:hypothetical protein
MRANSSKVRNDEVRLHRQRHRTTAIGDFAVRPLLAVERPSQTDLPLADNSRNHASSHTSAFLGLEQKKRL